MMIVRLMGILLAGLFWSQLMLAQSPSTPSDRFVALQERVSGAEADLADATTSQDISAARLTLQEARVQLQELQRSFTNSKTQLEADLNVLGPAPETGSEPDSIADLRQSYGDRMAEYDRLAVLANALQQRITQSLDTSAEQLRNVFVSRVLDRTPPPYLPEQITEATSEIGALATEAVSWISAPPETASELARSPLNLLLVLAGCAFILYLVNMPIKDRVAAQLWRRLPKRDMTPAGPPAIALARATTRILLAGLSLFIAHRVVVETGFLDAGDIPVLDSITRSVFILLCANAVSRALFAPDNAHWRIVRLSKRTASWAHRAVLSVALLFTIDQVLAALVGRAEFAPLLRLQTLVSAIIFGVVMLVLFRRLQRPAGEAAGEASLETTGPARQQSGTSEALSHLLLLVPALVMIAASLLGYAILSRWVFEKAAYVAIFLGYGVLLRAFLGSWTLLAVERLTFGKTRNEAPADDIIGFWTRFSVDLLVLLGALPVLLAIIGMEWAEIRTLALNFMSGFSIGAIRLSPSNILYGLLSVIVILMGTRLVQRLLENRILPMTRINPGIRHSLKTLVGYIGLVIAFFTGVSVLGFNLSNLAIIAGALSVGIGFGLQSIVNNFVSGLILLFERPIKIGDWVVTASGEGKVKKINVRSTEIETFDLCSIIVPNSELISSSVQNWTYKDETARIIIPVGVSYSSDPQKAREVLLKCAEDEPEILSNPAPYVYFADFADSSLNLELRVFIRNANKALIVRNDIRFKIFSALKEAGIEIPFPQRDIHVRSLPAVASQPVGFGASPTSEGGPDS